MSLWPTWITDWNDFTFFYLQVTPMHPTKFHVNKPLGSIVCLFVLRFYGPVNLMGSCRARSVYLTTRLLGRLSPLSG